MQHFNRMLNVRCCRNYICKFCCSDYLESKGLSDDMINGEDCNILLEEVPCPHCTCKGFFSYPVEDSEEVRDYRGDQISKKSLFSPLKVGDGFDELKRKMIPYQSSDFNKAVTPKKDSESDVGIFFYSPTSITDRFSPLDHRHQDFESPQLFPHLDSLRNSDLLSDSHIDAIGEDILQLEQSFGDNQTGLSERTLGIIRARAVELVSEVIQRVLSQQPDYYSAFDMVPQFVMGHIVQNYVDKIIANVSHQSDNSSNARNALVSQ